MIGEVRLCTHARARSPCKSPTSVLLLLGRLLKELWRIGRVVVGGAGSLRCGRNTPAYSAIRGAAARRQVLIV